MKRKKEEITETVRAKKADWPTIQAKLVEDAKVEVKDKDLEDAFK